MKLVRYHWRRGGGANLIYSLIFLFLVIKRSERNMILQSIKARKRLGSTMFEKIKSKDDVLKIII